LLDPRTQLAQGRIALSCHFRPNALRIVLESTPTSTAMRQSRTVVCTSPTLPELFHRGHTDAKPFRYFWLRLLIRFQRCDNSLT
jgi:hypothetical protein